MKILTVGAVVAAMLAVTGVSAQANLVANGNFSNGLTSWTVVGDGISTDTTFTAPGDSADAAFGGNGTLSQSVTTNAGGSYLLTFSVEDESALATDTFTVTLGGFSTVITGDNAPLVQTAESFTISAADITDTSTELSFQATDPASDWNLDDVSLVPVTTSVPEPASITLLVGGVLLTAMRKRKSVSRRD